MWKRFLLLGCCLLSQVSAQQSQEVQNLIEQWVKAEQLVGEEASEWKSDKARMNELLALYAEELVLLNETLSKSGTSSVDFQKKKEAKEEDLKQSESARKATIDFMRKLQPRVQLLIGKLPEPLLKSVTEQVNIVKTEVDNKSVRSHLLATVKCIQSAEKFNRTFTLAKHSIDLEGKTYNAEVMYLGLSRAFFLAGKNAGVGVPTAKGWSWSSRPELLEQIQLAFNVQAGSVSPALLKLPLKLEEVKNHD